jgi:hypothetical protein
MMYIHTAVAPDGTIYRGTTKRVYTHCLFAKIDKRWCKISWVGRFDLIVGRISAARRWWPNAEYVAVPCDVQPKPTRKGVI